ncbi:MAG: hypothetical protein BWK76_07680 [Desulfobulbaceae bacterium A2]|nr:MAG: hypothetical protein BWK76_07680 [Desulfobulbaceae bacterium A2]
MRVRRHMWQGYCRGLIHALLLFLALLPRIDTCAAEVVGPPLDEARPGRVIRLGVITMYHPLVMYKNYQPFVDYLTQNTPHTFELKISQDYTGIMRMLREGSVDFVLLGGVTYLEARKSEGVLPLLVTLNADRKPFCQGTFITREDNERINTLQDLRGANFAFASTRSTAGYIAPLYHLYLRERIQLKDFASYHNLLHHDSVAREVLRGHYDAGVVLDTVASKYQGVGIKSLGKTEPLPRFVLVAGPELEDGLVQLLRQTLLALDYDEPEHRLMMDHWDVNIRYGFSPVTDADYDPVRAMVSFLTDQGVSLGGGHALVPGRSR